MADVSYNEADVFDNIGRASYSIGFMTPTAFKIDITTPACGTETLTPILRRYNLKNVLDNFVEKVLNISYAHPLESLGTEYHPKIIENHINQFEFRASVALSCLFESNQGQKLKLLLQSLTSSARQKVQTLTSILNRKIGDLGQSMTYHSCLQIKK